MKCLRTARNVHEAIKTTAEKTKPPCDSDE